MTTTTTALVATRMATTDFGTYVVSFRFIFDVFPMLIMTLLDQERWFSLDNADDMALDMDAFDDDDSNNSDEDDNNSDD